MVSENDVREVPIGNGQVQLMAVNPATKKMEPVYRSFGQTDEYGNTQQSFYFKGDAGMPGNAQLAYGVPHTPSWGSKFDSFMGDIGVPAGLAAMAGGAGAEIFGGAAGGSGFVGDIPTVADVGGTSIYGDAALADGASGVSGLSGDDSEVVTGGDGATAGEVIDAGPGGSAVGTDLAGETFAESLGLTEGQLSILARTLGVTVPTLLGLYGSNELGNNLHDIGQQQHDDWNTLRIDRLPYLTASTGYLTDPSSYFKGKNSPGATAVNSVLRGLSVTGNPFGSPYKQSVAADAGMRSWLNAVTGLGAIGTGTPMSPTSTADIAGAQADAQGYNALGWGVGNLLNPQPTIADLLKSFGNQNGPV